MNCGACGLEIVECPECGGRICEEHCPDREEDGCSCEAPSKLDLDMDSDE